MIVQPSFLDFCGRRRSGSALSLSVPSHGASLYFTLNRSILHALTDLHHCIFILIGILSVIKHNNDNYNSDDDNAKHNNKYKNTSIYTDRYLVTYIS